MLRKSSAGLIKEKMLEAEQDPAATGRSAMNTFPVFDLLSQGKENAMSAQCLANLLRYDSVRELQKEIARERREGAVILSTCENGGGYFRPKNKQEAEYFIRTLESRARNTMAALHSARSYVMQQGERDVRQ